MPAAPDGIRSCPATITTFSPSAPVRAASGRRASRRPSGPASRSPRNATSAAPASTSAACRRSCWCTPRISARTFDDAAGFGWTVGETRFDWSRLIANKNTEIQRLNGIYENLLGNAGVEIINGHARLRRRPYRGGRRARRYTADNILIATGGWPAVARRPGRRTRDHLQRGVLPRPPAGAHRRRRRRLHRRGVRRHLPWPRIARHAALSRAARSCAASTTTSATRSPRKCGRRASTSGSNAKVSRIEKANGALTVALADGSDRGRGRGDVRHRARAEDPRASVSRRPASRFNDAGAVVVDEYSRTQRAEHLRRRRLHRPDQPDARGHQRGPGGGRNPVQRPSHQARPRQRAIGGLQPAARSAPSA